MTEQDAIALLKTRGYIPMEFDSTTHDLVVLSAYDSVEFLKEEGVIPADYDLDGDEILVTAEEK